MNYIQCPNKPKLTDLKSIIIHVFGAACAFIIFHNSTDSYPSSIS